MPPKSSDPKHVDISLSQGVTINWSDGHESRYPLEHLRKNCPCANCRNTPSASADAKAASSPFPMFKPTTKLNSAEAVGRYAIRLNWNDGHDTGIYSFAHLRDICPCAACQSER